MRFEIYIREGDIPHVSNRVILPTGNRNLIAGIRSPKKTSANTNGRDESIIRAREAYRDRLKNVLILERKWWQKK